MVNPKRLCSPWWCGAAVLLVLLRLVLVSHHEVLTLGWDSIGYLGFGAKFYWGSEYEQWNYTRVPTFPLMLSASTLLGVPFRLLEELMLAAAAFWSARASRVCGLHRVLSLLVFAGILFEPWTVRQFDVIVPDGTYACFLVMLVCQTVITWDAILRKHQVMANSIVLGVFTAITGTLRQEWPVALLPLLASSALWMLRVRLQLGAAGPSRKVTRRLLPFVRASSPAVLVLFVIPTLMLGALNFTYSVINSQTIGLFAPCDFLAPGYTKLHKALLSVPSERGPITPKLQAPTDVRMRVYQVSPTMNLLKPWLEGECLTAAAPMTRDISPNQDEYGAWLVFGIRSAAFRYKKWTSAGELDRFFEQGAREIRAAQSRGDLARRWTPLSFIAPEWGEITKQLPKSARTAWNLLSAKKDSFVTLRAQQLPPYETGLYAHVALQRSGLANLQHKSTASDAVANANVWHSARSRAFVDRWWDRGFRIRASVLRWLWWVPMAGIIWTAIAARRKKCDGALPLFLAVLALVALARFGLVILLDLSGVWAQPRYLLASLMLWRLATMVTLLCALQALVRALAVRRCNQPARAQSARTDATIATYSNACEGMK